MIGAISNTDMSSLSIDQTITDSAFIVLPKNENEIDPKAVEAIVREYFKDDPLLVNIARCESHFRQYLSDGSIHRGRANSRDVGIMQINEKYHLDRALDLGIDIYSIEGNLAYAKFLFDKQGSQPWSASAPCWKKVQVASSK